MAREDLADVLSEFARTMATDFPIQGILDHLVAQIVDILPITAAGVTLISPGLSPRYVAASGGAALRFEQLQTDLGEGPCLAAYRSGEAVVVANLKDEEDRFRAFAPQAVEAGLAAVFSFPLHHGEQRLGALDLYHDRPGSLSADSMRSAQTLADVAAAYLLNAQARADIQDISDQSREAALHDPLTGLPNRILMLERLDHAFLRGQRSDKTSALFFIDLDQFKEVNDTHGHSVGDELLVAVGQRLSEVLRPGDTLARLYGDEFVILCEDLDDPSQADAIAARADAALIAPFALSDTELTISGSIGIAFTGRTGDSPEQLLHDADLAMYRTKRSARTRQLVDLRELHHPDDQTSLKDVLPGAAERGELQVDYQPIVDMADGRLTGVEALLRWKHPSRGLIAPAVLIPLAEQSGLIADVGRWVLERASTDGQRWREQHRGDLAMWVNVSPHQLMSAGFTDTVEGVLARTSTSPRLLTLEVTESVFARDGKRALFVLNDLRDIGVKLALDDFGTGYSSLSYLMRFPVDIVKVDRTFVAELAEDSAGHTIVAAFIRLAHDLGMSVVCEGVETAEQRDELSRLGCDLCQGFYFGAPMSASRLDVLIQENPV